MLRILTLASTRAVLYTFAPFVKTLLLSTPCIPYFQSLKNLAATGF
jgi:hypothetical protein